jgi:hypothetical protein
MTATPTESAVGREVVEGVETVVEAAVSRAPVLITEEQVMLSTAAAVPLPRTKYARRRITLLRRLFMTSTVDERPTELRHYPTRRGLFYEQLERAAMSREMDRL